MSEERPKGRGAILLAAAKKLKEARAGDSSEQEVPKAARGRAALLEIAKKHALQKAGMSSSQSGSGDGDSSITKELSQMQLEQQVCSYKGESGKAIPATANYIALNLDPNKGVYEYLVEFDPPVDAKNARFKILNQQLSVLGSTKTFDGRVLYLPSLLFDGKREFDCTHPFNNDSVRMTITYTKKKRMSECIHLYNLLFKRIMLTLKYSRIGRQHFNSNNPYRVQQYKLEIWPGYVTAVDEYEGGVMLCMDTQHRVLRTQTVFEYLGDLRRASNPETFTKQVFDEIVGQTVLTRYNNKSYVIHDIDWDLNPLSCFQTATGEEISFQDYYKKQYTLTVNDLKQPLLINRKSVRKMNSLEKEERMICLIPEFCYLTGLFQKERDDFKVMKAIAEYTRVSPAQRVNALRKFCDNVASNSEAKNILEGWGLSLHGATIDLCARVLDPEHIYFANNVFAEARKGDWGKDILNNRVMSAIEIDKWIIIHTVSDQRFAKDFVETYKRLAPKMGIRVNEPEMCSLKDDRTESYLTVLRQKIDPQIQVVVTIVPTNRDDRYSAIKKTCCSSSSPIASQVILSRTLKSSGKLSAVVQKIALQINCKLGGTLWAVNIPAKNWMICGIDVFHSKGSAKSVCGFVSSINETMTRWYSKSCFHEQNTEIGSHFKICFIDALQKYYEFNAAYPHKVVVFRDGVGDGQLNICRDYEVAQFEDAAKTLGLNNLDIIFVVVKKRINTRLFSYSNGEPNNPPPGTIVDNQITRRQYYDFFLVPQKVNQGTVSPTHYVVLKPGTAKPDHIQRLAYKMCHMYYNWSGTVRVPAPCQYAHKLAYLIGQYVRKLPSGKLEDRLFYL